MNLILNVLNNPGLLAAIVIPSAILVVGIFILIIRFPQIKQALTNRRLKKEELKMEKAKQQAKQDAYADDIFKDREKDASKPKSYNTQQDAKEVMSILNREKKDVKADLTQKEENAAQKAKSNDVLNILAGKASNKKSKKPSDMYTQNVKQQQKEKEDQLKKAQANDVLNIVQGAKGGSQEAYKDSTKTEENTVIKPKAKTTNDVSAVLDILGVNKDKKN